MDPLSAAIVGFVYLFVVTIFTFNNQPVYNDKTKEKLKNSNNSRWVITIVVYLVLCFIMPVIFFMLFSKPYISMSQGLILHFLAALLSAAVAHIIYSLMKKFIIEATKENS